MQRGKDLVLWAANSGTHWNHLGVKMQVPGPHPRVGDIQLLG